MIEINNSLKTFISIMFFYIIITYVVFPAGFYYFTDKSLVSAGNGYVVGSIVSILLWYKFGRNMIPK
jgi:hypothetical protein